MPVSDLTVRSIQLRPTANSRRYWYAGGAFETHFFNALSSTFPEGERFFIQSVRRYAKQVSDPTLKAQIADFAGQEGQHSREHDHHVNLLVNQGYGGLIRFNNIARSVFRWFVKRLPRFSLALTAAIEHVTAITAHQLLLHPNRWLDSMDEDMRLLWHWHAVEETEHKAVAFDVYQATGDGYALRIAAMAEATVGFLAEIFIRHTYLLAVDGLLFNTGEWSRGIRFLWGREGLLRSLSGDHRQYWRRGFHPSQQDDRHLISTFSEHYSDQITVLQQEVSRPNCQLEDNGRPPNPYTEVSKDTSRQ